LQLGLAHALVDLASGWLVFFHLGHGRHEQAFVLGMVVLYSVLAFGLQAPLGWLADRRAAWQVFAVAGTVLPAAGLVAGGFAPLAGVVLLGVGNALFHVGAGAHVLRASGDRATESGVFVGPGAVGLAAGIWLGAHGYDVGLVVAAALLATAVPVSRLTDSARAGTSALPRVGRALWPAVILCLGLLFVGVCLRALGGGVVAAAWRAEVPQVVMGLALFACLGKMAGGFLGDRIGWLPVGVAGLVLSAPLFGFLLWSPLAAMLGMMLFQIPMSLTLKATHHLMPDRPGLAFGIPCLALLLGALPGMLGLTTGLRAPALVLGLVLVAAALLGAGLVAVAWLGASLGPAGPVGTGALLRRADAAAPTAG